VGGVGGVDSGGEGGGVGGGHISVKPHTRKGDGSVGTTPSSPCSTRRCDKARRSIP
jgi:hypothetical protein